MAYQERSKPEHSFVAVPKSIANSVWEADERLGSTDRWGLSNIAQWTLLELYSYTTSVLEESLAAIDKIAAATDVSRLFMDGQPIPSLLEAAPPNSHFVWGKRLSLLA